MNTKAKSNSVITSEWNGSVIIFTVAGVGEIRFNPGQVSRVNQEQAMRHGFVQRISDAATIPRNPKTGESATPEMKFAAMQKLVAHYESGTSEWTRVRPAGEGQSGGLLFQALCQMSPSKTPEEIKAWMDTKTKPQLNAIRNSERVAAIIAELRPVSIEVDVDAELADLGIE